MQEAESAMLAWWSQITHEDGTDKGGHGMSNRQSVGIRKNKRPPRCKQNALERWCRPLLCSQLPEEAEISD